MKELIKIGSTKIGEEKVNSIDARDLYSFLGVRSEFRNWIKNRIRDFSFTEGVDFIAGNFLPGSEQIDYFISLGMAKELSMVERNEKGKEARLYFIECEKVAIKAADQPYQLPTNFKEALLQLVDQVEQNEKLQITLSEQAPKVAALDRISLAEGTHCVTNAAKILQVRPKDLFDFLSFNRWTYKRAGNKSWTAYQDKIQQGLLTHKVTTVTDMYTGKEKIIEQVLVTPKGIATLSKKLQEEVAA